MTQLDTVSYPFWHGAPDSVVVQVQMLELHQLGETVWQEATEKIMLQLQLAQLRAFEDRMQKPGKLVA